MLIDTLLALKANKATVRVPLSNLKHVKKAIELTPQYFKCKLLTSQGIKINKIYFRITTIFGDS